MSNIIRAWKDETYRQGLSTEEQALLPANPAGEIELTETELEAISGACYRHRSFDIDRVDADAIQVVTFQPIFGGSSISILGDASSQCNNVFSPNRATAVDQD
jgi:mersacidin/lichenicidin family type 2 lantibiotic